ncbi:1-(5-phosphoribosyl)-5-[(5-phosphoribosylamino)methylideneamino]imidazole-4-carboxamide isomerase [Sinimarinibacterium sp. CAU 1509]|uniref:1-(5-phosphoribosyl)-5-[(5- phosphoribosylamino)methylideneamino]imidazole-4- carboxamide isomerase n=1 Tax=Sinimarinibacterium sp. CAU 1509 TaxID=2562283 RepID=UPI0010AD5512|nr:1-(5-phosphoribosyl)-5-[(5-phosphoribosylamino)methylideneamino]imidazole-4-carboxamide isomerase [Sinimarinibacterium sp. CAU 1509]TJY58260.1 1-(5-phosphoribosyl)-5-[(5-phosphoribosylamino)methylideneamino]imidazole-4-carboxamide isomerase [Sinimarinibacterium sp. CAU 1509]
MLLIPAIDLKGGQCVRLRQGRMDDVTIFSGDPVTMAKKWADEGAERLHVVDLDGAVKGQPMNIKVVEEIVAAIDIPVQVGGGIRDEETVQRYLNSGVQYVIIGTKAVNAPHFLHDLCLEFPRHIIVSLDAKDGRVALNGWAKLTGHDVIETAIHCERDGVEAIVYTDIARDGMLQGFNVEATRNLARSLKTPVLASGGVSSLDDIRALAELEPDGVAGAVIGRAIYEGRLDFKEAMKIARGG